MKPQRQTAQNKMAPPQSQSPNLRQILPMRRQMAQQNRLMRHKKPHIAPGKTPQKARLRPKSEAGKAGGKRPFNLRQCGVGAGDAY